MPSHLSGRPAENSMITAIIRYWIAMPVSPDESTTAPIITSVCRPTETSPRPFGDMIPAISVMCAAIVKMKISLPSSPGCRLVTPRLSPCTLAVDLGAERRKQQKLQQNIADHEYFP